MRRKLIVGKTWRRAKRLLAWQGSRRRAQTRMSPTSLSEKTETWCSFIADSLAQNKPVVSIRHHNKELKRDPKTTRQTAATSKERLSSSAAASHFPHASDCAATVTTTLAIVICPVTNPDNNFASCLFVVERSFTIAWRKELRCFVSRAVAEGQATLLGKQRWTSPELWMQLLLQNDQCALAAPPGNDQEFPFFVCRSKRSGLLCTKENNKGVAALLARVEGRSSTEGRQLMLSFIAWIRGSLLQNACGRCQSRSSLVMILPRSFDFIFCSQEHDEQVCQVSWRYSKR